MSAVKHVPEGFHSVTPHLVIRNAAKAIDFYKSAFGAEEVFRMNGPDGKIAHAEVRIAGSVIMIGEECPEYGAHSPEKLSGSPVTIHLYVQNVDQWFDRAVKAGATAKMPPTDMFWGDRYGKLADPFGHNWSVATHVRDVTPEECEKAMASFKK